MWKDGENSVHAVILKNELQYQDVNAVKLKPIESKSSQADCMQIAFNDLA